MSSVRVRTRRLEYPRDVKCRVGILEPGADHGGDGLTVGEIGAIHEFGLGNVPERSFIRAWFDEYSQTMRTAATELMQEHGPERGGGLFAVKIAASMQNRIAEGIDPPLSPVTIARRLARTPSRRKAANTKFAGVGGELLFTPLIDRGILKSAIVGDCEVTT